MQTQHREEFVVQHDGEQYDIGRFLHFHPGGRNTLAAFRGKDITKKLGEVEHSNSALYLMKDYRLRNGFRENDGLESLVDWNKGMLSQVGKLGARYNEWVHSPVDRKLRLFESDVLEAMTKTPWYLVPAIWVPVIFCLLYVGISLNKQYISDPFFVLWVALWCACGFLLWTLFEYSLHRWLFHLQPPNTSPRLITFHFLIHGLHHKVPFDESRLLFPPVPAALIAMMVYVVFDLIFPKTILFIVGAGFLTGYVTYDLIHFYLHYGSPKPDGYLYHMKRYHNQHHFTHHQSGFGISSPLWDQIFKTKIYLKKLKQTLRW